MTFLKKKITRIIAFILSCLMVFGAVFFVSDKVISSDLYTRADDFYELRHEYEKKTNTLFTELWTIGTMYLRNLDDKGKFVGNEYEKESTENALKELGLMDSKGKIKITDDYGMKYYVSWWKNSLSNTDKPIENDDAHMIQADGSFKKIPEFMQYPANHMSYLTTHYGVTIYNMGTYSDKYVVATYDFDTNGLDTYYDYDYQTELYYKTDGSTPTPNDFFDDYEYGYYNNDYIFDDENEVPPNVPVPPISNRNFSPTVGSEIPLTIRIQVPEAWNTAFIQRNMEYNSAEDGLLNILFSMIPLFVIAGILMLYVFIAGGYSIEEKKFKCAWLEKVWIEAVLLVVSIVVPVTLLVFFDSGYNVEQYSDYLEMHGIGHPAGIVSAIAGLVISLSYAICCAAVNTIIIRLKCRCFWKTSLIGKIALWLISKIKNIRKSLITYEMLRNDIFVRRFLFKSLVAAAAGIVMFIISVTGVYEIEWFVFSVPIIAAVFVYSNLKDYKEFTKISEKISRMSEGDFSAQNDISSDSIVYGMSEKLNCVSDNLKETVDKQLKSERMKIDLVTNVSHDLKTPLTSIISYINLLSNEELSPEARDYVTILEQKSQHLKELVADVFDIAKATSRTDINTEKIDFVVLINQVIADLSDKIENSGKAVRTTISIDEAPIISDGKKLYRVIQNLIDNALKYSLDNTRIFITLSRIGGKAFFQIKNTAAYEMNFAPDEITERFTRGDESRSTEGNGLGLAIAKNFTEACGGEFYIEIDGDSFIANVIFEII